MQYDTYGERAKAILGEVSNVPSYHAQIPVKKQSSNRIFGDENDSVIVEQVNAKAGKKQYHHG